MVNKHTYIYTYPNLKDILRKLNKGVIHGGN